MNRRYTREKYLEHVRYLKQEIPDAELTTDLIVGFPTDFGMRRHKTKTELSFKRGNLI